MLKRLLATSFVLASETLFGIASNTKAFTGTALGMLVEEGNDLVHWRHDSVLARWDDRELRADAFVTFNLNPERSVKDVSIIPASESVDFSFDFQDLHLKRVNP